MAKISIQQKPTFTADVEIPRIGDKPVKVPFTFAYLDRAQLAEYEEVALNSEKAAGDLLKQEDIALVAFNGALEDAQFNQLKKIVKGWGFDDEFNDDNLRALVRSSAHVPRAVLSAYRDSYQKSPRGKLIEVVRALYTPDASAEQLALFGLEAGDVDDTVELWAANAQSFSVFEAMGTQWRMGMAGATGLDYQALPVVLDMAGLRKRKDRAAIFADLRIMEREALRTMADNRE